MYQMTERGKSPSRQKCGWHYIHRPRGWSPTVRKKTRALLVVPEFPATRNRRPRVRPFTTKICIRVCIAVTCYMSCSHLVIHIVWSHTLHCSYVYATTVSIYMVYGRLHIFDLVVAPLLPSSPSSPSPHRSRLVGGQTGQVGARTRERGDGPPAVPGVRSVPSGGLVRSI